MFADFSLAVIPLAIVAICSAILCRTKKIAKTSERMSEGIYDQTSVVQEADNNSVSSTSPAHVGDIEVAKASACTLH
eukprot:COSAG02_NODE_7273_length_3088_cov_2.490800_3_plen_77_part_00